MSQSMLKRYILHDKIPLFAAEPSCMMQFWQRLVEIILQQMHSLCSEVYRHTLNLAPALSSH